MKMTFKPKDDVRSGDGQKTIDWLIKQMEDIFIDVGAHIGWIAIPVILATKPSLSILMLIVIRFAKSITLYLIA